MAWNRHAYSLAPIVLAANLALLLCRYCELGDCGIGQTNRRPVATTEESGRYVIQSKADSLLGELSKDFSEIVIQLASEISTQRTKKGLPVITVCDIAGASQFLCSAIDNSLKTGETPREGEVLLEKIKVFCDKAIAECKLDGGQPSTFGTNSTTADRERT